MPKPARTLMLVAVVAFVIPGKMSGQAKNRITHGPILGRVASDTIGIWARTKYPGTFRVRYGTNEGDLKHLSRPVTTELAHDNAAAVILRGLKPATTYYYELLLGERRTGLRGSFRTLPDGNALRDPKLNPRGLFNFSFEYACGNNQNAVHSIGPSLPAFKTMLRRLKGRIDFAILNGDWLYENSRDYPVEAWRKEVGAKPEDTPRVVKIAPTIVGVWKNYKVFLDRGKPLRDWHRHVPSFFTFDDHEILNDVWGAGEPGIRERRAVFRDIGVQAWYDYLGWSNPTHFQQPIHFGIATLKKGSDVLYDPEADFTKLKLEEMATLHVHWGTKDAGVNENYLDERPPGEKNAGVYGIVKVVDRHRLQITPTPQHSSRAAYSIGRRNYFKMRIANCDFFFLDTRSHRMMHDLNQRDKPGISILGKRQKQWLKREMAASDADFLFVISSVNLMIPHIGGGKIRPRNKDDSWAVFLEEREELIRFWDELRQPIFVLTGDLHNSFAIRITDNLYEFASGPHNSHNHIAADEGNRPANGVFDSFGRKCLIKWSSYFLNDIPRVQLGHPHYCVVQVNNVFNSPKKLGRTRWVAFPIPQVIFRYYDGRTGDLRYAESILARPRQRR